MKKEEKEEYIKLIKYGFIGLLVIAGLFSLDYNSRMLFWLLYLSLLYVINYLEKKTIYKCIIVKDIIPENEKDWDSKYPEYHARFDGAVTNLIREFSLPFPPYQGLAVWDSPFHSEKIETVTWDEDKKRFICRVPPFKIKEKHTLGQILVSGTKEGWIVYPDDSRAIEALKLAWKEAREKEDEEYRK